MTNHLPPKARYVLAQKQDRLHHCHWPGCNQQVAPARWGCRAHWFALPKHLRDRIWRAYRPGQERDQKPSAEYVTVAREVQAWIAKYRKDSAMRPTQEQS
jgi:hypothetical protein